MRRFDSDPRLHQNTRINCGFSYARLRFEPARSGMTIYPISILLLWSAVAVGQSTPTPSDPKPEPSGQQSSTPDYGLGTGAQGNRLGLFEILSDRQGVDFDPYLKSILENIRQNWYLLIPESSQMKKGKLAIEFAITKNGKLADMRLIATSGNIALDRAAWGSITTSNPFPPLPTEFNGSYLALRMRFYYNPDKSDLAQSPSKSAIAVSISPTDPEVPVGGSKVVTATVTGANKKSVRWSVIGTGCSGSACGKMKKGSYLAPHVLPSPPFVILTAASKADPTVKASVTVHIVQPAPPQ